MRAPIVFALGSAAAFLLLPARLSFTPAQPHQPLLKDARSVPGGEAFAAGGTLRLSLPAPDPDAGALALKVRLRRATNVTRVVVENDRKPVAAATLVAERPSWLVVPLEPQTREVRLTADAERDGFATLYLVERLELRRQFGLRRLALVLLPGLIGGLAAWLLPAGPLLASLAGLQVALAVAAAVAHTLDAPSALQFGPEAWRRAAWGFWLSLAALTLLPRLRLAAGSETAAGPRLRRRHVLAAALTAAALALLVAAAVVSSRTAFVALYGEAGRHDVELMQRARASRQSLLLAGLGVLYLGAMAATLRRLDRLGERATNLAVGAAITAGLLGAVEGVLAPRYRPSYWPRDPNLEARAARSPFLADPELGHLLNPESDRPYRINSARLRGPEIPARKPAGEWRIATLGDSIPFGADVAEDAPFGAQLEGLLRARAAAPRTYRVLNAGVPAYDSLQTLRALRRVVLPLQPDVVIVTVGWNDLSWSMGSNWHAERSIDYRWQPPRFRSALLGFAEEISAARTVRLAEPDPRAVSAFRHNLEALVAFARARGVRVLLTNMPTVLSAAGNSEVERRIALGKHRFEWRIEHVRQFEDQIGAVCAANPEIGCARDLFPLEESGKGGYFRDHCHPNADGHALIARRLQARLLELGWL